MHERVKMVHWSGKLEQSYKVQIENYFVNFKSIFLANIVINT